MKKLLALLLALSMVLALAACGSKDDTAPETEEETPMEEPETEAPEAEEPEDEEETEEPESQEDEAESQEGETAQKPAAKPSKPAEKPAQKPAAKPSKPAEKPAKKVDLAAFYQSAYQMLSSKIGADNMPAMEAMDGESMGVFYPGLSSIAANQRQVYWTMMSAVVAEIALVEVQNASDVQAVKNVFQARIDAQVGDDTTPGGAWYPDSIEGWKNNSRIVSNGNYVMMVVIEGCDDVVASFNGLFA